MAMSSKLLMIVPLAVGIAGCAVDPVTGSYDPGLGETVAYAKAVQTIDPDPVYAEDGAQPGAQADKLAPAVKRYRTDAVKAVEAVQTTSGGGTGGGGGPQ
jgi:hypothetical protein